MAVSDQLLYCLMPRIKQQRTDITVICIECKISTSKFTTKLLYFYSFIIFIEYTVTIVGTITLYKLNAANHTLGQLSLGSKLSQRVMSSVP